MTGSLVLSNSFGRITCEDIELCFVDILLAQPQRSVFFPDSSGLVADPH